MSARVKTYFPDATGCGTAGELTQSQLRRFEKYTEVLHPAGLHM